MYPLLVGYHNIRRSIFVDVINYQMYPYTGIIINLVRDPRGSFARLELKPIEDRRIMGSGVASVMGKVSLSGNQIRMSITIDILKCQGMSLGNFVIDFMFFPGNSPVFIFYLLMPPDPVFMRR